jgi:Fur family iron response transcriptional regulator
MREHFSERPYAWTVDFLRRAQLRPTSQRMNLVRLLFSEKERHVLPEQLYEEAKSAGISLSLATVYNTLHQFKEAGVVREIIAGTGKTFFDTKVAPHYHLFFEKTGKLVNLMSDMIDVKLSESLPAYLSDLHLPDLKLPDIKLPDIRLSDLKLPDIKLPNLNIDLLIRIPG